jgi:hypothetical protein
VQVNLQINYNFVLCHYTCTCTLPKMRNNLDRNLVKKVIPTYKRKINMRWNLTHQTESILCISENIIGWRKGAKLLIIIFLSLRKFLKKNLGQVGWGCSSVVNCLPSIHKVLDSIPSSGKKKACLIRVGVSRVHSPEHWFSVWKQNSGGDRLRTQPSPGTVMEQSGNNNISVYQWWESIQIRQGLG